jgi:hypothetical protein
MSRPLSPRWTLGAVLTALLVLPALPGDAAAEWIPENSPAPASSRFT